VLAEPALSAAEISGSNGCQAPEPAAPSSNSHSPKKGGNDEVAAAEVEEAEAEEEAVAEDEAAAGELEGAATAT